MPRPAAKSPFAPEEPEAPVAASGDRAKPGATTRTIGSVAFKAELDITEIDARGRPGVVWTGRATEISRSQLVLRSRRMCYEGRELLVAVHLVDDRPVALYGMVAKSEYDGDGLYRTVINLLPLPETESIRNWTASVAPRVL